MKRQPATIEMDAAFVVLHFCCIKSGHLELLLRIFRTGSVTSLFTESLLKGCYLLELFKSHSSLVIEQREKFYFKILPSISDMWSLWLFGFAEKLLSC